MNEISTEKLLRDVKVLIDDVEELLKATAGFAGDRVVELRERLQRKLAEGKAALAQCEQDLRQRSEQVKVRAVACWQHESCRNVALAVGIGVLLGLALRRRR